jgi:hypothetical protein
VCPRISDAAQSKSLIDTILADRDFRKKTPFSDIAGSGLQLKSISTFATA